MAVEKGTTQGTTPKGKRQIEDDAEKARKVAVDKANEKNAADKAAKAAADAKVPLTDAEKEFMVYIEPKLNKGRMIDQPSSAEMLRYSQLKTRLEAQK